MLRPPFLATIGLLACSLPAPAADPINEGTLTLVNEAGVNALTISISVPWLGSDSQTTNLTGTLPAEFAIDPATDTNSELTFSDGDISASDIDFDISSFFGSVIVSSEGLGGTVFTTTPPGAVLPQSGLGFDAALHEVLMNQGTISGTALGNPINVNLVTDPFSGAGSGDGEIILSRKPDSPTRAKYDATIVLPVDFNSEIPTGVELLGTEIVATVSISGTIRATGQVSVPLSDYLAWTETQSIPGADPTADSNHNGIQNGITWALGLDNTDDPRPHLLVPDPATPRGFLIALPPAGTAGALTVEVSPDLSPDSWLPADPLELSTGANPLPPGTTGTVTILPSTAGQRFLRLRTDP